MSKRIVDACCLINFFAAGNEESIFQTCGQFWIPAQVQNETLRVRRADEDDPAALVWQEIDLNEAVAAGYLHTCQLEGQAEIDAFVRFAMQLDDGEASCLAIALSRGWTVATDDRKARRIASENGIALISTPEVIQRWVDANSASGTDAGDLLRKIERFAKFRPRRSDPLYGWWVGLVDSSQDE